MVRGMDPSLADAVQVKVQDPAKFTQTFVSLRIKLIQIQIIYGLALGHDHSNSSVLHAFLVDMKDREGYLENSSIIWSL